MLRLSSRVVAPRLARALRTSAPALAKNRALATLDVRNNALANEAKKVLKQAAAERGGVALQVLL